MEAEMSGKASVTRKRLQKERYARIAEALRGGAVFLLGTASGLPALAGIMGQGLARLALAGLAFFMSVAGLSGMLRALSRLPASRSAFGRTVLSQTRGTQRIDVMCARIDRDLAVECREFGPLSVGREWAVGDGAMQIARICGIFSVAVGRSTHALCLIDVDDNLQVTIMDSLAQAEAAAGYLRGRLPQAMVGDMDAYRAFLEMDPAQRRVYRPTPPARDPAGPWEARAELAFRDAEGIPTSRFTLESVRAAVSALEPGDLVGFDLLKPQEQAGRTATGLFLGRTGGGEFLLYVSYREGNFAARAERVSSAKDAVEALVTLMESGKLPDFCGWARREAEPEQEAAPAYELHADGKVYPHNTLEDVDAVLDGLENGGYNSFSLMRPGRENGGMFVDRTAEGYRVMAALPDGESIRWMETVTERKDQVRFWMEGYYTQSVFPYMSGWEDITKQMERET